MVRGPPEGGRWPFGGSEAPHRGIEGFWRDPTAPGGGSRTFWRGPMDQRGVEGLPGGRFDF